jgi:hypothetical protein
MKLFASDTMDGIKPILLLSLLVLMQSLGFAQMVNPHVENYRKVPFILNEKISFETDRQIYMAGEEINISCDMHEPVLQRPLELSKVIYIEFYTFRNLIIEQIKIGCENWHGQGTITIPKYLPTGQYYIRAYTNYMKNFGASSFSYGSVTILNPFEKVDNETVGDSVAQTLFSCKIYPEGGNIIYGHPNNVVCLFSSKSEQPVSCAVKLFDDKDRLLLSFKTNAYGVGNFTFVPMAERSYHLEARSGSDMIHLDLLIHDGAVSLVRTKQDEKYLFLQILNHNFASWPLQLEVLNVNSCKVLSSISEKDSIIIIPVKELPKGIIQFQLKDTDQQIISHRFIYNSPITESRIEIKTGKKVYLNRETIELAIQNSTPYPIQLSVSVYMINPDNLKEYMDYNVQKYIQQALYPFLNTNKYPASEIAKDDNFLDCMLIAKEKVSLNLSQHFNNYENLTYIPEIHMDLISGNMVDNGGNPVPFGPVMLTWQDTIAHMQTTRTDANGRFIFESDKTGVNNLVITGVKYSNNHINLQNEFFSDFIPIAKEDFYINPSVKNVLQQQLLNLQINDSFHQFSPKNPKQSFVPFYFKADKTYLISDFIPIPTLEEFLFEIVPEVMILHNKGKTSIRMHFPLSDLPFGEDPLFLVDGVPVFDSELIAKLKCSDLLSVDIINEKYFYKNVNFDGILDIHTKTGDASIVNSANGFLIPFIAIQNKMGINRFDIPLEKSTEPFFRTELYWNDSINTPSEKLSVIGFVAPDNYGVYLVRCTSTMVDGSIGYSYTTFSVGE